MLRSTKLKFVVLTLIFLMGCAGTQKKISLEPGKQVIEADVDIQSGAVTQQMENVEVSVQAAMLPEPNGDTPYPTFWITIRNNRDNKITIKPAQAMLIDSFGKQYKPLAMSTDSIASHENKYVVVDPYVHTYFSLNFGWPFYPLYPHRGWTRRGPHIKMRRRHYDPFWHFGTRVRWVNRISTVKNVGEKLDKEEVIYHDAKLTYVIAFPELKESVKEMRLMVPEVSIWDNNIEYTLDFELVFNQNIEIIQSE